MREGSLKREPRWIEMGERLFQLSQLRRWPMYLHAGEIRQGEHFREQRAHIVEMRENAFGIGVAFAAENFVTVDGKAVEKIFLLRRGFLDEAREPGFDRIQFSGMDFKIRMKADEVRERAHARNVCLVGKRVEQARVTLLNASALCPPSSVLRPLSSVLCPLSSTCRAVVPRLRSEGESSQLFFANGRSRRGDNPSTL